MQNLSEDILQHIFDSLEVDPAKPPSFHSLTVVIRVNKAWRDLGQRILYAVVDLNFGMNAGVTLPPRIARLVQTLRSSPSCARVVRHLAVSIAVLHDNLRDHLVSILTGTTGLLSLEIKASLLDSTPLLPESLCLSRDFLPLLTALNTNDYRLIALLAPRRPIHAIRVSDWMDFGGYNLILAKLISTDDVSTLEQLQLQFKVDSNDAIVQLFASIIGTFSSISVLGLQFHLPSPKDVSWDSFYDIMNRMGPPLARLYNLHTLCLTIRPDPVADKSIRDFPNIYEERTEEIARKIVTDILPNLRRIELRWHGWTIENRSWIPVSRLRLLRSTWFYADIRERARSVQSALGR